MSLHNGLEGQGGRLAPGRWHSKGRAVIYTATSPAGALLEVLVNLDIEPGEIPDDYRLLGIDLDDSLAVKRVGTRDLPVHWKKRVAETRALGDDWLAHGTEAVLVVPSSVIQETDNVLIAPDRRADRAGMRLVHDEAYAFDMRLMVA